MKEIKDSQSFLNKIKNYQSQINSFWNSSRWIYDIINNMKNKSISLGTSYLQLFYWYYKNPHIPDDSEAISKIKRSMSDRKINQNVRRVSLMHNKCQINFYTDYHNKNFFKLK